MRELDDELGLSAPRFSVLARLRYDGEATIGQLARAERVAQPSMTQLVGGLERAGLVLRHSDPADGRRCIVRLTPAGRALIRRARARKIAWVGSAIADLDDAQLDAL